MIYDQEVIRITLYVTGMYLGIQVKVPKDASILIAMKIVTADSANVSPRTFKLTLDRRGFFSSITVEQENGPAVSRQGHTRLRADGFYSFKHQARAEQPLLVWQYYLSDRNDIPKSGQDGGPPELCPSALRTTPATRTSLFGGSSVFSPNRPEFRRLKPTPRKQKPASPRSNEVPRLRPRRSSDLSSTPAHPINSPAPPAPARSFHVETVSTPHTPPS